VPEVELATPCGRIETGFFARCGTMVRWTQFVANPLPQMNHNLAEPFRQQAASHPKRLALSVDGEFYTYGELFRKALKPAMRQHAITRCPNTARLMMLSKNERIKVNQHSYHGNGVRFTLIAKAVWRVGMPKCPWKRAAPRGNSKEISSDHASNFRPLS
jgi:hypothetical protein